jgi:hypothetical protein
MSVQETIIRAIRENRPLRIVREGHERFTCPYRIGWSAKKECHLLHYQFGGYSQRGLGSGGSSANWRCHRVDSISEAQIIDGEWREPAVKPKTRGNCIVTAEAEVAGYY